MAVLSRHIKTVFAGPALLDAGRRHVFRCKCDKYAAKPIKADREREEDAHTHTQNSVNTPRLLNLLTSWRMASSGLYSGGTFINCVFVWKNGNLKKDKDVSCCSCGAGLWTALYQDYGGSWMSSLCDRLKWQTNKWQSNRCNDKVGQHIQHFVY